MPEFQVPRPDRAVAELHLEIGEGKEHIGAARHELALKPQLVRKPAIIRVEESHQVIPGPLDAEIARPPGAAVPALDRRDAVPVLAKDSRRVVLGTVVDDDEFVSRHHLAQYRVDGRTKIRCAVVRRDDDRAEHHWRTAFVQSMKLIAVHRNSEWSALPRSVLPDQLRHLFLVDVPGHDLIVRAIRRGTCRGPSDRPASSSAARQIPTSVGRRRLPEEICARPA